VPGDPPAPRARSPFVKEASKRGIFAYITDSDVEEWQSAIVIVLVVTLTTMPSARPTTAPIAMAAPTLRA
jgi:hypothetical protein